MNTSADDIKAARRLDPANRSDFSVPHLTDFKLQVEASHIYNRDIYQATGFACRKHIDTSYTYSLNLVSMETEPYKRTAAWYKENFEPHRVSGYTLSDVLVLDFIATDMPVHKPNWRIQLEFVRNVWF